MVLQINSDGSCAYYWINRRNTIDEAKGTYTMTDTVPSVISISIPNVNPIKGEWRIEISNKIRKLAIAIDQKSQYSFREIALSNFKKYAASLPPKKDYDIFLVAYVKVNVEDIHEFHVCLKISNNTDKSIKEFDVKISTFDNFGNVDEVLTAKLDEDSNSKSLSLGPGETKYVSVYDPQNGNYYVNLESEKEAEALPYYIDYSKLTEAQKKLLPSLSNVKIAYDDGTYYVDQ